MNNGLGRWILLIFKCFRFSDGGWGGTGGGEVTCLYSWRGGGGGGAQRAWTRIILPGPCFSPPLLFELWDPQKGYNENVVSIERNTNRKCIYDNLRV